MYKGDGSSYGIETGLTKGQFIVALFDKQKDLKLSDKELVQILEGEFPNCSTKFTRNISYYRSKYNKGEWACQTIVPEAIGVYGDGGLKPRSSIPGPNPKGYHDATS